MESENFSFVYVADDYTSSLFSADWKLYLILLLSYLAVAVTVFYCFRCLISNSAVDRGYYHSEDDIELGYLRATTMTRPVASGVIDDDWARPVASGVIDDDRAKDYCFEVAEDLFPVVEGKKGREGENKERFEEPCMICMDDFEDEDQCRVLPCSHVLHVSCINEWWSVIKDTRCPLCRSSDLVNV